MNRVYFLLIVFFCIKSVSFISAKKILLTGGAGFIGSHVAEFLLERGDAVVILDNLNDAYDTSLKRYNLSRVELANGDKNALKIYEVDICDIEAVKQIFEVEKLDVICHLAARAGVRASIDDPYEYSRTNNNGIITIFEMARMFRVNHIVCASSSSVYGVREHGLFSEDDAIEYQTSIYGVTKRFGELLGYVYHRLYDMSITNLRFFTVYGPRARIDMAPFIFMDALHHNKIITIHGDGSAIRDFTYVRDIVNGIVKAIDRPLGYQILNLGRGEPIILSDFIATMENIVGKKACIHYGPEYMSDVPITHANISKAKDLLDYQPLVSIHAGLQHMYDWYKNEYLAITCKKKCNSPENNIVVCHI